MYLLFSDCVIPFWYVDYGTCYVLSYPNSSGDLRDYLPIRRSVLDVSMHVYAPVYISTDGSFCIRSCASSPRRNRLNALCLLSDYDAVSGLTARDAIAELLDRLLD